MSTCAEREIQTRTVNLKIGKLKKRDSEMKTALIPPRYFEIILFSSERNVTENQYHYNSSNTFKIFFIVILV